MNKTPRKQAMNKTPRKQELNKTPRKQAMNNTKRKQALNKILKSQHINGNNLIASGSNGGVYKSGNGVKKIVVSHDRNELNIELDITKVASASWIAPLVYEPSSFVKEVPDMKDFYYLVIHMENMKGTLESYVTKNGGIPTSVLQDILLQIELLHGIGICHNDIHAQNVMYNNKNQWYLVDFGRATFNTKCSTNANMTNKLIKINRINARPRRQYNNATPRSLSFE